MREKNIKGQLIFGLVIAIVLFYNRGNAQDSVNYKIPGYCGQTKLSDINAEYGEAAFSSKAQFFAGTVVKQYIFDYGQIYKKDKEVMVSNEKGEPLTFGSVAAVLNFFDYNGWQYIGKEDVGNVYILLFKKKRGQNGDKNE